MTTALVLLIAIDYQTRGQDGAPVRVVEAQTMARAVHLLA